MKETNEVGRSVYDDRELQGIAEDCPEECHFELRGLLQDSQKSSMLMVQVLCV